MKFGPPIRPKSSVGAMDEQSTDSEEDSGKEEPSVKSRSGQITK